MILDHKLNPYLIEVNSSPSFGSDTPLDKKIKKDLIYDTVKMLNLNAKRKAQLKKMKQEEFNRRQTGQKVSKQEKEAAKAKNQRLRDKFDNENLGDYHPIFPHPDPKVQAQFQNMLEVSARLWQDFTSGVSRTTLNQAKQGQPDPKAHKLLKDPRKTEPLPKSKAKGIATLDDATIQPGGISLPLRPMLGGLAVIGLVWVSGTRDYLGLGTLAATPGSMVLGSFFEDGAVLDPSAWAWKRTSRASPGATTTALPTKPVSC